MGVGEGGSWTIPPRYVHLPSKLLFIQQRLRLLHPHPPIRCRPHRLQRRRCRYRPKRIPRWYGRSNHRMGIDQLPPSPTPKPNPTGEPVESATVCNASETQESTADAWETLAVRLSSSTQMMVSPTWLETPLSVLQTAPSTPQESGPRTSSSRTGSKESSLPNFFFSVVMLYRNVILFLLQK